ncbi:MAG: glycosyltransferase 87 family protein [Acidimicrobiia bacterium]
MTPSTAHRVTVAGLGISISAVLVAVAGGFGDPPLVRAALVVTALAPLFLVALVPALRAALTLRAALFASLVLTGGAVALPSNESHDLWSYAMDGRIVSQYGSSPYVHSPAHYPHDAFLHLVGSGWRATRSVYGPVFTWVSAAITGLTGADRLATRLAFQLLAAAAVLLATWLVARETRDPLAVLVVGANPVVAMEIVNPGRNDALVGLAVLGAVLLVRRRRPMIAVAVLAVAALVKIVAVLALGALILWLAVHGGRRVAARAVALGAALLAVPYALAGGVTALRPLATASDRLSRASVWQVARRDGIDHLLGSEPAEPVRRILAWVGPFALCAIAVLALVWVLSRLADPTPELVVVAAIAAFLLAGSYVLASYVMWVLPLLAWRHHAGVSRVLIVWSSLLLLAYQSARGLPSSLGDTVAWVGSGATVAFATVALVGLTVEAARRLRRASAAPPEPVPMLGG